LADDQEEEIAQARLAIPGRGHRQPVQPGPASGALGWALRHRDPDQAMAAFDRYLPLARRGAGGPAPWHSGWL
jgi:hypothetical protein